MKLPPELKTLTFAQIPYTNQYIRLEISGPPKLIEQFANLTANYGYNSGTIDFVNSNRGLITIKKVDFPKLKIKAAHKTLLVCNDSPAKSFYIDPKIDVSFNYKYQQEELLNQPLDKIVSKLTRKYNIV